MTTQPYIPSQAAIERRMREAAAGGPQIIRHGTLGVFVLSSWEEWCKTAHAAGQTVPENVRMTPYSDEEWDLDEFLEASAQAQTPRDGGDVRE